MALTLKLATHDAEIVRRVLLALVARPEACESVLQLALASYRIRRMSPVPHDVVVPQLVRIAGYIETAIEAES